MKRTAILFFTAFLLITSCSKKQQPQSSIIVTEKGSEIKKEEGRTATAVKKTIKVPVAKIISVDDRAAKRTPDGRLYYDVEGRRYWKNYDDGRYYLFSKKMYTDPAFKPH